MYIYFVDFSAIRSDANKVVKHRLELYQQALELVSSGEKDSKLTYNADWKYE